MLRLFTRRRRRSGGARRRREPRAPAAVDAVGRRGIDRRAFQRQRLRDIQHRRRPARNGSTACSRVDESRVLGSFGLMTRQGPGHDRDRILGARRRDRPRSWRRAPARAHRTSRSRSTASRPCYIRCDERNIRSAAVPRRSDTRSSGRDPRARGTRRVGPAHDLGTPPTDLADPPAPFGPPVPRPREMSRSTQELRIPVLTLHLGTFTPKRTRMSGWGRTRVRRGVRAATDGRAVQAGVAPGGGA